MIWWVLDEEAWAERPLDRIWWVLDVWMSKLGQKDCCAGHADDQVNNSLEPYYFCLLYMGERVACSFVEIVILLSVVHG